MKRKIPNFFNSITPIVSFKGKRVLEIGCGEGVRSRQIANLCRKLIAIDSDATAIEKAKTLNPASNIQYLFGSAVKLNFPASAFDMVIFTFSFHHVPINRMKRALSEAIRVMKPRGFLIFIEPDFAGTFYESQRLLCGSKDDERAKKARAYFEILNCSKIQEVDEIRETTVFHFDSVDEYFASNHKVVASRNKVKQFLEAHRYILTADRRVNVLRKF
ncbi:MAG: class I SAM-dependent methyltransferase [bacterium]